METNEVCEQAKKKNFFKTMIAFLKSHKRLMIAVVAALAVIAICITVVTVLHSARAKKIEQAQIGKCYILNHDSEYSHTTQIWYFQEIGYSKLYVSYSDESRQTVDFLDGSLKEISGECSIKISLFGQHFLEFTEIEVDEQLMITNYGTPEWVWTPISLEEALAIEAESNEQYAMTKCEHKFGTTQVIKKSTCSSNGEEKQVCQACGYEQIKKTKKLEHNYVNKVCSVCGTKKSAEKSDIKANTWYVYNDVLYFQNCKLVYAHSANQGKAMTVQYYAVCQHCHAVDEVSKLAGPEVNYEVEKIHYCDECGKQTLVRFKID